MRATTLIAGHLLRNRANWARLSPDAPDRLVQPGTRTFHCAAELCHAMCCQAPYLADASAVDVRTLEAAGRAAVTVLDGTPDLASARGALTDGSPVTHARLQQRSDGVCVFLQNDLRCGVYAQRPTSCAMYPYVLLFVDAQSGRMLTGAVEVATLDRAVAAACGAEASQAAGSPSIVPLLLRDRACPGFTGKPLSPDSYVALLKEIWSLDRCFSYAATCDRHPHPASNPGNR